MFKKHHGSFGRRVLHRELLKENISISEYKIRKIMRDYELESKYGRKKSKNLHSHQETAEKCISENIYWNTEESKRPQNVWSCDFTEQKVQGKTMYTCGIIDVNKKILVTRITGSKNNSAVAIATLTRAIEKYGAPKMIMTDRGAPFVSLAYREILQSHNIAHSMSRPHTPRDNRYIETFWHTMKTEIGSVKNLTLAEYEMVLEYYEYYYNNLRPHSALNYRAPLAA